MTKERIQYIFIYIAIALFILAGIAVGVYFFINHQKWQGYRNDPDKQKFIAQIEEILAKDDKTGDDLLTLGNGYYQLGENELAISVYKKALATDAKDVAGSNLVNAYMAKGDYGSAEKLLYSMLKDKNNGDPSLYLKLSELYKNYWEGRRNDSLGILLQGLDTVPNSPEIMISIAGYYADHGDNTRAIEYYEKSLEFVPENESIKAEIERLKQ